MSQTVWASHTAALNLASVLACYFLNLGRLAAALLQRTGQSQPGVCERHCLWTDMCDRYTGAVINEGMAVWYSAGL